MGIIKKGIRIGYWVISALIYRLITAVVPKKKNRWIFGSWKGKNYSDNSRALFEYTQQNHPEIDSVWVSKNLEVYKEVTALGYKTINYNTLKGKLFVMSAKVSVQTESNKDTGKYKISGTKVIQLWHGLGDAKTPYNKMGFLKKKIAEIYSETHHKSIWMAPSEHQKNLIHDYFDTPLNNIFVTGSPRTDVVMKEKPHRYFEQLYHMYTNAKFIAYMPTHRKFGKTKYNILGQPELKEVNDFLCRNNMFLFIKPHPLEMYKYTAGETEYSHIIVIMGEEFDNTQEYLHYFDVMISDYSSIVYDYLCFNRPIILFSYDFEEFKRTDMGLRNDYVEISPGLHCSSWTEVCYEIAAAFSCDNYRCKREKLIPRYYRYLDANNCKRVFEQIEAICK